MKKMSIFALLLLAVVATSSSVSGTYAKYTSTFTGTTDSARVAKWAFNIEGQTDATQTFNFDLFNTVNDTLDQNKETDVKDGGTTEVIIAPGTEGSFELNLQNNSEVNATYTVNYDVTNNFDIPVEFKVGTGNWTNDLEAVVSTATINMNGGEDAITIQWRWAFTGAESVNYTTTQTELTDTALGNAGTATISVQAIVNVTQNN